MELKQRIEIKPLSVNKAWKGRRFKTNDYKAFEKELLLRLKTKSVEFTSVRVDVVFGFSNSLSDIDNPTKCFLDIICKKYGFDDRIIQELNIKKEIVKKGKEFIDFKLCQI